MRNRIKFVAAASILCSALGQALHAGGVNPQWSIARQWNEETLQAIRLATPRTAVHARNLYHVSAAMYDAWAVYDATARGVYFFEKHTAADVENARRQTISYAAYRVLKTRFGVGNGNTPTIALMQSNLTALMVGLGYDPAFTSTVGNTPAAIGNRLAAALLATTMLDGSMPETNYAAPEGYYVPQNIPLITWWSGTQMKEPDHWQQLAFNFQLLMNGQIIGASVQFVHAAHWKQVAPFAIWSQDQNANGVYFDHGPQPHIGEPSHAQQAVDLLMRSASLGEQTAQTIDISPAVYHNSPLGTYEQPGYGVNPVTGNTYAPNLVLKSDYQRALAEYWFDGASTATPAGHWFEIANSVADIDGFPLQWMNIGDPLNRLEWDVKMYLALGGSVHDAAIAAWSSKFHYDAARPMSFIRYMGQQGQSSDPDGPSYNPQGLPLVEDLVRLVEPQDVAPGGSLEEVVELIFDEFTREPIGIDDHVGDVVVRSWAGGHAAGVTSNDPALGPGHVYRDDAGWHAGDFELGPHDTPGSVNPNSTIPKSIRLSEIRLAQPGRDIDEYIEIAGPPGASLDGTWLISIGTIRVQSLWDPRGRVRLALDLSGHAIGDDGVFLVAPSTCTLATPDLLTLLNLDHSDNATHAIVTDFTGYVGQDLDFSDNGILDFIEWSSVVDSVSTKADTSPGSLYFGSPTLGPVPGSSQRQGVEWKLADRWMPYQHKNWIMPPYPGHVSGHSALGRAAAETLADITGSSFFPDGLFSLVIPKDSFKIERGPSQDLTLQWASYFDAADEAGESRLWAGVDPIASDLAGRLVGAQCGPRAVIRANALFAGLSRSPDINGNGTVDVDDLLALINQWGSPPGPHQAADITGNGAVDTDDLLILINNWT